MSLIEIKKVPVQRLNSIYKFHTIVDVLRLDLVHPVISGNKWFKLKEYLKGAKEQHKKAILTFGGAYSNHILATAAAANACGLDSIGIIRGENSATVSPALEDARNYGMKLLFISRTEYKTKVLPSAVFETCRPDEVCIINEGGYGKKGVEGAKDILRQISYDGYDHIVAAVGTGTMLAGLVEASSEHQKITGIPVLKNNFSLRVEIEDLVSGKNAGRFLLNHDYHFGGYAKYTQDLFDFMNDWYLQTGIPTDFVYTGKLFFALNDLILKQYFRPQSKILVIHSGGLQGNRSLPKGTLIF